MAESSPSERLSPRQLLAARLRSHRLPARGRKEHVREECARQQLRVQNCLREHYELVSEERVERLGTVVCGQWCPKQRVIQLTCPAGKFWQTMGFSELGKQFLLPEEALYLMECGNVQVFYRDLPLSIQEGYEMFLSHESLNLQEYQVYSHLKRLGYVVTRFQPRQESCQTGSPKRKRSYSPVLREQAEPSSQSSGAEQNDTSGRSWWVERAEQPDCPYLTMSPSRTPPRWDFSALAFPDLGSRSSSAPLPAPNPTLLPGGLSVGVCYTAPWLQRLNRRHERGRGHDVGGASSRGGVNEDEEVRRCRNWAEYHSVLRKRRSSRPPLWEDGVKPLIHSGLCSSTGEILEQISVISPQRLLDGAEQLDVTSGSFRITFDVFQPDSVSDYKKSSPGKPYSRMCVCSFEGPVPDLQTLKLTALQSGDTPVTFAVVDHGDVSFYCFRDFQLPRDTSH